MALLDTGAIRPPVLWLATCLRPNVSLLIPAPKLEDNEGVLWRSPAGFTPPRPTVGGTLYATTRRLLFIPNRLNFLRRSRRVCEWPITQLASVGVLDRDFTPYTGGMHNRLEVTLNSGEQLQFVVKEPDVAVEAFRRIMAPST
jgi:hypothetical protein